jgi:hypothetical protein
MSRPSLPSGSDALSVEQWEALGREWREASWRDGDLRYKLHDDQLTVYEQITPRRRSRFLLEIARRWGKTWLFVVMASRRACATPAAACPTARRR